MPNRALSYPEAFELVQECAALVRPSALGFKTCEMLKLERHDLLRSGAIRSHRVEIWRRSGRCFSAETTATARLMGYTDGNGR
jgi:hypothetical protein